LQSDLVIFDDKRHPVMLAHAQVAANFGRNGDLPFSSSRCVILESIARVYFEPGAVYGFKDDAA